MCKAKELSETLVYVLKEVIQSHDKVFQRIGSVEKEITDVEHFIENENFNIVQGYYYAKTLQKLRQERRQLKNEMETLKILNNNISKTINISHFENLNKQIKEKDKKVQQLVKNKVYVPRKLTDINKENIKDFCMKLN